MVRFFGKRRPRKPAPKFKKPSKSRRPSFIARLREALVRKWEARRRRRRPLTNKEMLKMAEEAEKDRKNA